MALISHLVEELAESLGTAKKSITVTARWLREDGLLSQKGRGRGAAQATPLDAARLLIALMIRGKIKNAPQVVRDFGQLVHVMPSKHADDRTISLAKLCGLPDGHTFEEGLAALIGIWGNEDAMRAVSEYRDVLASAPPFLASLQDHKICGSIRAGDAKYNYAHPTALRFMAGQDRQPVPSGNNSSAAWEEIESRYKSGIESLVSVNAALLQPLGEVVADLREPGSGIQQNRRPSTLSGAEDRYG